jgi:hypothetical protein
MALLLLQGGYLRTQTAGKILLTGDDGAVVHVLAPPWRTADAGNGTGTVAFPSPLDPSELKVYTINWAVEMDGIGDRIATSVLALDPVAVTAGLLIHATTNDQKNVSVWFKVADAEKASPRWNGAGETHRLTSTVTAMGGQVFERTVSLPIRQLGQATT